MFEYGMYVCGGGDMLKGTRTGRGVRRPRSWWGEREKGNRVGEKKVMLDSGKLTYILNEKLKGTAGKALTGKRVFCTAITR
jgi:phage gp46-like protein